MIIHAVQTGSVQIKRRQQAGQGSGIIRRARTMLDDEWTEPLPIHAWIIQHDEGVFVVDTGETCRTSHPDYFPSWHPYYRTSVRFSVLPEDEIGVHLREVGIRPSDVKAVVLTHLHTDHAGGLRHFPKSDIYVDPGELKYATGAMGRLRGYLPGRWPSWFDPKPLTYDCGAPDAFRHAHSLTARGDLLVVPTPGHTPNHVSVLAMEGGLTWFLAGDTSYSEQLMLDGVVDGVSPSDRIARGTLERIQSYAGRFPTVYLPSHDPATTARLVEHQPVPAEHLAA